MRTDAHAIEHAQTTFVVDGLGCGDWLATCRVQTRDAGERYAEQKIEVKGGMCDGGGK